MRGLPEGLAVGGVCVCVRESFGVACVCVCGYVCLKKKNIYFNMAGKFETSCMCASARCEVCVCKDVKLLCAHVCVDARLCVCIHVC